MYAFQCVFGVWGFGFASVCYGVKINDLIELIVIMNRLKGTVQKLNKMNAV